MQDQSDNMDDLFRKAAEDYPLNVGVPDWNKIAGAVSATENAAPRPERRYRRFLWLLLLIPFGIGAAYVANKAGSSNENRQGKVVLADKAAGTQNSSTSEKNEHAASANDRLLSEQSAHENAVKEKLTLADPAAGKSISEKLPNEQSTTDKTPGDNSTDNKIAGTNPADNKKAGNENAAINKSSNRSGSNSENTNNLPGSKPKSNISDADADKVLSDARKTNGTDKSRNGLTRSSGSDKSADDYSSDPKPSGNRRNPASDKLLTSFDPAANSYLKSKSRHHKKNTRGEYDSARPRQQVGGITAETEIVSEPSPEPSLHINRSWKNDSARIEATGDFLDFQELTGEMKQLVRTKRVPRFYVGIAGGVDLSTVKLQKFSRAGSQYGGIVGYQFAKKWSIEAGVFMDTKYYYTDGEYFDKGGLTVNPSSRILAIDGVCRMFEIPLSIKYDLSNTYRSNWFVSAGLSSYIMKKENYDMLYLYTGSGSTAVHKYEYLNSSRNFFSQLRLTAGYAYKLPRNFSIRLEPYINVPVSGVGYGKLNLNSAGINAGLFKRIF